MKSIFFILSLLLMLVACESRGRNFEQGSTSVSKDMAPAMDESQSMEGGGRQGEEVKNPNPKIIRNGNMTIQVDDAVKAKAEVETILTRHKAYSGNEHFDNTDYSSIYHIQIRVPAENLDALIKDLESIDGLVKNKSINATDVSEEYIDLETRLTNKRAYLEQYRQLLKSAKTIADILKMQEQIRALEEEIESVEGRLRFLQNKVALSTLDLTLMQQKDFVYRSERRINFFERLKDSVSEGWYGLVQFFLLVVAIWPFWLILFLLIWLFRRYVRKRKNNPLH